MYKALRQYVCMPHISVARGRSFQETLIVSVCCFALWLLLQVYFLQPLSFAPYFSFHHSEYKFGYVFYIGMVRVRRTSSTRVEHQCSKEVQSKKKDKSILTTNTAALHAVLSHPGKVLRILLAQSTAHPALALLGWRIFVLANCRINQNCDWWLMIDMHLSAFTLIRFSPLWFAIK